MAKHASLLHDSVAVKALQPKVPRARSQTPRTSDSFHFVFSQAAILELLASKVRGRPVRRIRVEGDPALQAFKVESGQRRAVALARARGESRSQEQLHAAVV